MLDPSECGSCTSGQYRCPLSTTCVNSAAEYMQCPNLTGTLLDWNLPVEERIDHAVATMTLEEQTLQLQNAAPASLNVGLPFYNCQ